MIAAALVFAFGCALSVIAPVMEVLLIGRVAQGLGGGGLVSLAFVAVPRFFPDRLMPRVMAAMSLLWGASAFLGPLVGGLFATYGSWRAGFGFFAAQAVLLAVFIWVLRERDPALPISTADATLPYRRLALLCLSVLAVAFAGIVETPTLMALSLSAGVAALVLFVRLDAASGADRLWPQRAFDPRHGTGAALLMLLAMSLGTMGLAAYGPLLMALIHGTPVIVAGYVVAAISIAWTVAAVIVSGAPERLDPVMIVTGMALIFLSVAGSAYAVPAGPVALIAVFAACEGFGFGMAWTFVLRRAKRLAPEGEVERLTASVPTISRLGYALGASVVGIFANSAGFDASASAEAAAHVARTIFLGSLPFAAIGFLAALRFASARS
ncbi:putative multidrug-efflux transporter [Defluviimonas aquaemixtae]|uniref:Putative multidrug-efflux transporter n=2 Tax=Albidovulum aquaemixtae TaxID=1542388 RepID=A0A2R8B3C5_9RHOB|nr:putative multidrug-efflux transporter [Defluviimonas aquaemixtae]